MNKTTCLQQINRALERLERSRHAVIDLPELERIDRLQLGSENGLVIFAPHDMALEHVHRDTLVQAGWRFINETRFPHDGSLGTYFQDLNEIRLTIYYCPELPGSTCKLRLIGYEKAQPIYEVTCPEG